MSADVKLGWDSVLVSIDGVVTKTVFPADKDLKITIQPSMLPLIDGASKEPRTLNEVAHEYVALLKIGGSYQDLDDYCGSNSDQYVKKLKSVFNDEFGIKLPNLKPRPRKPVLKFDQADVNNAVFALNGTAAKLI